MKPGLKKIPLARAAHEDALYWSLSSNGHYTYKTSYEFLKVEETLHPLELAEPRVKQLWKGVWVLGTTNKVKNLMWRACRNSLPTKQNLVWQVLDNLVCDCCQADLETPLHAFWSCLELDVV